MITSYNTDSETQEMLDKLALKEDRSRSKIINNLIKKEYKKCRNKK